MKITLALLFFIFINGCGYNPIYKSINKLSYNQITLIGDKNLNRKISSALSFKEDKSNSDLKKLTLEAKKNIIVTSKNSKGQIQSYRMVIYLDLLIEDNDKIIEKRTFVKDFAYNNKENKFELSEYENQIENNLMNEIIEQINIYLNA